MTIMTTAPSSASKLTLRNKQKLLIVGSVAYDSIQTPFGQAKKTLGGSASYFSLAAGFFARPSIIAVVGEDFKKTDVDLFNKRMIDISGLQTAKGKTFHWAGKYHYDLNTRDTLKTKLGVFEKFAPKLSSAHKNSDYVFLGNIHPKLQLAVLKQINKPRLVGLDTMNFWIEKAKKDLLAVIKKIDLLVINEAEARQLSGQFNLVKASKGIMGMMGKNGMRILIIKQGEYGLLMFQDDKIFNLPGYPLENVIDPTGAGDSFAGGLMGYLAASNNLSWNNLKKACVVGSTMASFCVEKMGVGRLLNLKIDNIASRQRDFKQLTHFDKQ